MRQKKHRKPNLPPLSGRSLEDVRCRSMSSHSLQTTVVSPVPRDLWDQEFKADRLAVPYQSPRWFDGLCAGGHFKDASRMYELSDGRRYILPLACHSAGPLRFGAASMPHGWGMGGLISRHEINADVTATVFNDLMRLPLVQIGVRPNPQWAAAWAKSVPRGAVVTRRLAHLIDLAGGFEQVWAKGFSKVTRASVRKAERLGVRVECDTSGRLMPVFDQLLRLSVDRWAAKQNEPRWMAHWRARVRDPFSKFEQIAATMGQACKVWVAWYQDKPAAAIIVLQDGHNAQDIRGAIDREVSSACGANDYIQKLAIEDACQSGCRWYHMGETGDSKSLAYYKMRFGAAPIEYADYLIEKLPISRIDRWARRLIKRAIKFRDTTNEDG